MHRFLFCWCVLSPSLLSVAAVVMIGCSRPEVPPSVSDGGAVVPGGSYDLMVAASEQQHWELAWQYAGEVLIASPDDPVKLARVAEVAFQSGHRDEAADLLVDAARAEGWGSETRIQQALRALLAVGRLCDGIDMLAVATQHTPQNTVLRRLLCDLLVATEQHSAATEHRRELIQARDFDLSLLMTASAYARRPEEVASLKQMMELNPSDLRPGVGEAKQQFDVGKIQAACDRLRPIVANHPDFVPAQVLLGRTWVLLGEFKQLDEWSKSASGAAISDSDFWLTLGDWATERDDGDLAIECYGRAAKLAPHRVAPWQKLAALTTVAPAMAEDSAAIRQRAELLTQLRQDYAEASIRGLENPDSLRELAQTSMDLGWLWEAEAWAAVGLTQKPLSPVQESKLTSLRQTILNRLRQQTPWDLAVDQISWKWLSGTAADAVIAKFRRDGDPAATIASIRTPGIRPIATSKPLKFSSEAELRGLKFFGRTADDLSEPGVMISEMLGCGGGTIDYDLDGWPDVYLITAGGTPPLSDSAPNAMFRNLEGRFRDVSAQCDALDRGFGTGVAVGDVNEDGFDDLLVLNYGGNRIWINNGDGTFADHSDRILPSDAVWSTSAAIADLNADGLCDIVIANYCAGLEPSTFECTLENSGPMRSCSPNQFPAEQDDFYAATRDGIFIDVTADWGATPAILGRGLGIVAGSLDDTPGMDVLIANDMTSNHFWTVGDTDLAEGASFGITETGSLLGLANDAQSRSQGSMGIAIGDFNADQIADFYTTNYVNEYNMLSISQAGTGWRDRSATVEAAATTMPMVGFGTQAIDFDLNGSEELIVTNGHVDDFRISDPQSTYEQPMQLFRQSSPGRFDEVGASVACEYFQRSHLGRALWTLDANRDGSVDVLVTHQSEPVALLVNQTEGGYSWIGFHLVGRQDSRNAVGGVVSIGDDETRKSQFLTSGDGYLCSNERCVRFGLGEQHSDVRVEVRWASGKVQTWAALAVDREWLLVEDDEAFEFMKFRE